MGMVTIEQFDHKQENPIVQIMEIPDDATIRIKFTDRNADYPGNMYGASFNLSSFRTLINRPDFLELFNSKTIPESVANT